MSDPPAVPRPAPSGDAGAFGERIRALRGDARVGIAVLLCVSVAAGVAWFRAGIAPAAPVAKPARGSATTVDTTTTAPAITTTTVGEILVDVVGAVRVAGVVTLPASARVLDAIRAAGGTTAGADLDRLNLAAKLGDGARIAVPLVGQPPPAVDPAAVSGAAGPSTDGSIAGNGDPSAPINVNTAPEAQLEDLPGIGPTLAAAIVAERERNGPFRSPDDLTRVHGIGAGRLAQLRDFVTV
ncbi:MAG: competence protein ComEA [Actinomycetota bacterium]|jgi:competence protein ComEA|nr:competence protein ComEA [Actinomycetota bacterium]